MTDKIDVEVSATTAKAVGALNDLIDKLAALNRSGPGAAKSIDAVERSAAKIAASLKAGTSSINQQSQAIKALITQYQALNKAGLKGTASITQRFEQLCGGGDQAGCRLARQPA
jgi:uncharacterized phage infection (PIP) family protein YhgE